MRIGMASYSPLESRIQMSYSDFGTEELLQDMSDILMKLADKFFHRCVGYYNIVSRVDAPRND
jgi:hypothetical protein